MSSTIEQIKEKLNITDIIKDYVALKQAGANFKALCPFHQEKTPSFMVSPSRQIFKCFGCGKGGDIFTFLQNYEGINFAEALKILAQRANVHLEHFDPKAYSKKNRIYEILKTTADFYHTVLVDTAQANIVRDYLKRRQIDDLTRDNFKLGYSPNNWLALSQFLRQKKFTNNEIIESGLVVLKRETRNTEYYDRFRNRLMFPIQDEYQRVVGFGGRTIQDNADEPKYINTPQTEVYNKSKILYGLDKAKDALRKENLAILVEGYMDVISSHKIGVRNVVAVSGTALTNEQLQLIQRFTKNIAFAFDMDDAGLKAALRSYLLALNFDINIKVISLPLGKDPDELVRNNPELWRETIKKPQHILDYYFQTVLRNCDLSKIENKKQVREKLLPYIFNIPDPLEKNHFLSKLSNLLDLTIEELNAFVHYYPKEIKQTKTSIISTAKSPVTTNPKKIVFHLIALIVARPQKIWGKTSLPNISIKDQKLNQIYQELRTLHNHQTSHQEVLNKLKITGEEVIEELFLLADKDYGDLDEPEIQNEFLRLVEWLNNYTIRVKRNKIIKELRTAEEMQDGERIKTLVEMLDKLK